MRFETTSAFDGDYRRLKREHALAFKAVVREKFAPECDAYAEDSTTPWPASLRGKPIRSAAGILEMTWSLASPDGRATFGLVTVDGELRFGGDESVITMSSRSHRLPLDRVRAAAIMGSRWPRSENRERPGGLDWVVDPMRRADAREPCAAPTASIRLRSGRHERAV